MLNFLYKRINRNSRDACNARDDSIRRNASNSGTLAKVGTPAIAVTPATVVTSARAGRKHQQDASIRSTAGGNIVRMQAAGDTLKTPTNCREAMHAAIAGMLAPAGTLATPMMPATIGTPVGVSSRNQGPSQK